MVSDGILIEYSVLANVYKGLYIEKAAFGPVARNQLHLPLKTELTKMPREESKSRDVILTPSSRDNKAKADSSPTFISQIASLFDSSTSRVSFHRQNPDSQAELDLQGIPEAVSVPATM
jgi:hypothetical protein